MKYLIEWILKVIVYFFIISPMLTLLIFLTIIMWDIKFMDIGHEIWDYYWKTKKKSDGQKR